jgi:hypothetical protein
VSAKKAEYGMEENTRQQVRDFATRCRHVADTLRPQARRLESGVRSHAARRR